MNKKEKELLKKQLEKEKEIIASLKKVYQQAEKDIQDKIDHLLADELTQSKIYQAEYQQALRGQISAILDNMDANNYTSIQDYLKGCYEDGYIGTMYNLAGQGIPLIMPIDQEAAVKAIQLDSKISEGLYKKLGINTKELKKSISSEVARGISGGFTYQDMARNLNNQMNIGRNKAIRIARTEGHRVNQEATMDGMRKAKDNGADIVKQWDSTLDGKTRPSHQRVDGEIREMDEAFSNGLDFPGDPNGPAKEVVNCRCVLLQRAKWALDEDELETLKQRAEYFGLDKTSDFEDFKKKYLKAVDESKENVDNEDVEIENFYTEYMYGDKHAKNVKTLLNKADNKVKRIWNEYQARFNTYDPNYKGDQAFYRAADDKVQLDIEKAAKGNSFQSKYNTFFHEYGHMTDYLIARDHGIYNRKSISEKIVGFTENGDFILSQSAMEAGLLGKTAKNELDKLLIKIIEDTGSVIDESTPEVLVRAKKRSAARKLLEEIRKKYPDAKAKSDISDILEGAGIGVEYPLGYGHGHEYWKDRDNSREIFAELFAGEITQHESVECIKEYFPETYKVFRKIVDKVGEP